jgi:hypothetical protein
MTCMCIAQEHPCSSEDGEPPFADASDCRPYKTAISKTYSLTSATQDAEQDAITGHMYTTSSDLEFCSDVHGHVVGKVRDTGDQLVLIVSRRFTSVLCGQFHAPPDCSAFWY